MKLARKFFDRKTLIVACELLGKFLVRRIGRKTIAAMITETEAYCGPNDLASHASRGRTPRTEVMFGPPGYAYVYMIYGLYHCLNIVTGREGYPAAVLIRAVSVERLGLSKSSKVSKSLYAKRYTLNPNLNGPGKLCRHFQIDRNLNKEDLITSKKLWFEDRGIKIQRSQVKCLPRVGVDYAGKYKDRSRRFYIPDS